jgi:stage III sporulation protein AH
MNSKRQTIWLVSMLSLMVVLSAYYLFTEDASKMNTVKNASQTEKINVDNQLTTPVTDLKTDAAKQTKTDIKASTDSTTKQITDQAVLEKVAQQGKTSEDYFIAQQMQRNDNLAKQTQSLQAIINDLKQNPDTVGKAYDDLQIIQTQTAKINDIEDQLMQDYPKVVVTEAENKWKVVVQENKLEKSQAVSIVDLVTKELNIGFDNISIQVMPQ